MSKNQEVTDVRLARSDPVCPEVCPESRRAASAKSASLTIA